MDRQVLIDLLQDGMQYPPGKHRLWISRCFEITVHPGRVVELDEYEQFFAEQHAKQGAPSKRSGGKRPDREMFHVGKSIIHLKEGRVVERSGAGWQKNLEKA